MIGPNPELGQYFTPMWAAEALVERYFSHLTSRDCVIEPSCGEGAFLNAIPAEVPAFGVEIDPMLAARARANTGRSVIQGDFRTVPITLQPTAMIANPPFNVKLIDGFLDRAHELLPDGALAGLIVPAYVLQTPSRVERYNRDWSMSAELIPRTLFQRLSKPLVFCLFRKDRQRTLVGMALYNEARSLDHLSPAYAAAVREVSGSAWRTAVLQVLANLGGESDLQTIYRAMERRRPSQQSWWKDKVRQVVQQRPFVRTGEARYAIELKAAA